MMSRQYYVKPSCMLEKQVQVGAAIHLLLGHRISSSTITLDPAKTQAIRNMQQTRNRKDLQRLLDLCGYYRRCILQYSALVFPLTELVKNATGWR